MAKLKNYPEFHCHPQSLDTASTPEAFVQRELELETGTITATDHGTLAGCPKIYELAHKGGYHPDDKDKKNLIKLTPILGNEFYFRDDDCPILKADGQAKDKDDTFKSYLKYSHVTTHFLDQEAYHTGIKLLSNAPTERHGSESKPIFDWNALEELGAHNVTVGSGCLIGITARHLVAHNRPDMAIKHFERLKSIVKPGNLYMEVFPHQCDKFWVEGVFVELQLGDKIERIKFRDTKKLRTNVGEINAIELEKAYGRKDHGGHETLLAVKDYSTWNEREPAKIISVKYVEDYVHNDCTPFSPDGDLQKSANTFILELAQRYKLPVVVSGDSHFAYPHEKVAQDVRLMAGGGSWRMANCFERSTMVDMADGTTKEISKIKIGDMVKTYDFTNKIVTTAPVTAIMASPAKAEEFMANQFFGANGRGNVSSIISTKDHLFWDGKQWVPVQEIVTGCIRKAAPNQEMQQILNGMLLGDASISLAGRDSDLPYFMYGHAESQKELTEYAAAMLQSNVFVTKKSHLPGNVQDFYSTATAHPMVAELYSKWYPFSEKEVPEDLELTPLTIAWWFMDDGCFQESLLRSKATPPRKTPLEHFHLYTNGFSEKSVDLLIKKLKEKGIDSHKSRRKKQKYGWYIVFRKTVGKIFQEMVAPHIMPVCRYKLPSDFQNRYVAPNAVFSGETIYAVASRKHAPIPRSVWKNRKSKNVDLRTKYDIEVKGHHCFFVNGILVHNSYHRQSSLESFEHFHKTMGTSMKEFEGWVQNSVDWAGRFKDFKLGYKPSLPTKFYPADTAKHMMALIKKHGRMSWGNEEYEKRLRFEMKLLHKNGTLDLFPYFFLAEEVCQQYENSGMITGCARGSSGGLLIAYLLGVTHIDPIKHDLSVDRFLTLDRIKSGKLPDVDLDFPSRDLLVGAEEEVIEMILEDGSRKTVKVGTKVQTERGLMDVEEAANLGLDIKEFEV